jgi:hypothetical protein
VRFTIREMRVDDDPHLTLMPELRKDTIVSLHWVLIMETSPAAGSTAILVDWSKPESTTRWLRESALSRDMHEEGMRMSFVETALSNSGAIKFFRRMGYGKPKAEVWMRKNASVQKRRTTRNPHCLASAARGYRKPSSTYLRS